MRKTTRDELIIPVISIAVLSTLATAAASAISQGSSLNVSRPLYDGEILTSAGGTFALGFFSPNINSSIRYVGIWYNSIPTHDVVWVANSGKPVTGFSGSLSLTPNGTLVLVERTNSKEPIIWHSSGPFRASANYTNPTAQLLETGNLVVRQDGVADAWQSFDYPSSVMLPGMFMGWDLRAGVNRNLTSWAGFDDPSQGIFTTAISLSGVPQLIETQESSPYWNGGPWVGNGFSGMPLVLNYPGVRATFVTTSEKVGWHFESGQLLLVMKLFPDGTVQWLVWLDTQRQWNAFWKMPQNEYDEFSPCGPFGVVHTFGNYICGCLPGFRAKVTGAGRGRFSIEGCVRNDTLDCPQNGMKGDGFVAVSAVKLPDTTTAVAARGLGLDECRIRCLANCSCTAYSLTDVTAGGSGCIMWTGELKDTRMFSGGGQDLHVRVAAADIVSTGPSESHHNAKKIAAVVVPVLGGLLVGFLLISCLIIQRRRRTAEKEKEEIIPDGNEIDLPLFNFETIAEATNNFSDDNKLGEGGFGPVYKGRTKDGKEIAIKRLSKSSRQGITEFKNEIMLIAKLQHRNLVRLLGCCIQKQERMLVYEYMPNKSLDKFLFDKEKMMLLNWEIRCRIIIGIARGLLYLHQDSVVRVIHRDLKASNILLNQEMVPKISDFGLARIFEDEAKSETKKLVGTYGYMSPEYVMNGFFSVKSDVFSFGVLLLEVLCNQRNRSSHSNNHVIEKAWNLWNEGKALELVDSSIGDSYPIAEVLRFIKVGLLCVQDSPDKRPNMSSVVLMLTGDNEVLPEPGCPGFVSRTYQFEVDRSCKQEPESVNKLTYTIPHGR